jgi:hypothetical protein
VNLVYARRRLTEEQSHHSHPLIKKPPIRWLFY